MKTKAHFYKIKDEIIGYLKNAKYDVRLAVAWLTDEDLILELTKLVLIGINVTIVISNSDQNFVNPGRFKKFLDNGGLLYICKTVFMHHKFCVIDQDLLINGSYNWSYTARGSEENIIAHHFYKEVDQTITLLQQFIFRFNKIVGECEKITYYKDISNILHIGQASILSVEENRLISLHKQLEQHIQASIKQSQLLKIQLNYDDLQARIIRDGGGANFIHRILREEMSASEMKSGFRKLEEFIPHKVELSLEYLVCLPEYYELFNEEEIVFCMRLMNKYNLFKEI